MKFAVTVLVPVALAACSSQSAPTAPAPVSPPAVPAPPGPASGSALLWVMVLGDGGLCIQGATIQMVRAGGAGEPIAQTPCAAWDSDGGVLLTDLTPGVEVTLRGAAPGYAPREMKFLPFPVPGSYHAVFIELSKAQ